MMQTDAVFTTIRRWVLAVVAASAVGSAAALAQGPHDVSKDDLNLLSMWMWLVSPDIDTRSAEWVDYASTHYTADAVKSEFASLTDIPAASRLFKQCLKRLESISEERERLDQHQVDLYLIRVQHEGAVAQEEKLRLRLRDALEAWLKIEAGTEDAASKDALEKLREELRSARSQSLLYGAARDDRQKTVENEIAEFRRKVAIEMTALDAPPVDGSAPYGVLVARLAEHCARLKVWVKHLRLVGTTTPPAPGDGPGSSDGGTALPPPPAGTVFRLSGMVDQEPANQKVNKGRDKNDPIMTITSGTITLTFIADQEPGPPGGHVEITPNTTLTYIYDYHAPHPNEHLDRLESSCKLTGGRFVANPAGGVFPGIVGGYDCEVTDKGTGKTVTTARATGALRLDFRWDPYTSANRWFLMFVNGPYGAEWRLN